MRRTALGRPVAREPVQERARVVEAGFWLALVAYRLAAYRAGDWLSVACQSEASLWERRRERTANPWIA